MAGVENTNSSAAVAAVAAPWTQIVRPDAPFVPPAGEENYSSVKEVESPDDNAGGEKKPAPAWSKKPASEVEAEGGGAVAVAGAGAVVMGAESWPALSESTGKASPKLSPSNSSMNLPDLGSNPPQKSAISTVNYFATPNQVRPVRQKPIKREVGTGGGVNAPANGVFSHNQPPHNHINFMKNGSSGGGGGSESSGRDNNNNNAPNHGYREPSGGMRNPGGDHPSPRGSFRRGNGGPHSRGDGSHQNYGGRRGDQDWNNQQRNFNGRDAAPLQPRVSPRGYVRPTLGSAPFVHPAGPPHIRPFVNHMAMPDVPMIYFPPVPIMAPVPPVYYPMPDLQLQAKIASQIDYYFSNENLVKDTFLRQNMDKDGWVSISLIASFKKVKQMTENIPLILDALRSNSNIIEVKGDKIRRRDDYMRWVMPHLMDFSTGSGMPSPRSPN